MMCLPLPHFSENFRGNAEEEVSFIPFWWFGVLLKWLEILLLFFHLINPYIGNGNGKKTITSNVYETSLPYKYFCNGFINVKICSKNLIFRIFLHITHNTFTKIKNGFHHWNQRKIWIRMIFEIFILKIIVFFENYPDGLVIKFSILNRIPTKILIFFTIFKI